MASTEPSPTPVDAPPPAKVTGEFNVLCYTLLALFFVFFAVWLLFSWTGYSERYAPHTEGWYTGGTRSVEVTLIREDNQRLSCASDVVLDSLHCGYRANQQPFESRRSDDRQLLRPYSTVEQQIFLGAGLWSSPGLTGPLPAERFTVVCNFRMVGALKSVSLRWAPNDPFSPVKNSLPAGVLTDCVIPR